MDETKFKIIDLVKSGVFSSTDVLLKSDENGGLTKIGLNEVKQAILGDLSNFTNASALTATDDFNTITQSGIYQFYNTPINSPVLFGILFVATSNNYTAQIVVYGGYPTDGQVYIRFNATNGDLTKWGKWYTDHKEEISYHDAWVETLTWHSDTNSIIIDFNTPELTNGNVTIDNSKFMLLGIDNTSNIIEFGNYTSAICKSGHTTVKYPKGSGTFGPAGLAYVYEKDIIIRKS